jgi:hypothetical protein
MPGRVAGVIGVPCAEQARWSAFWGSVCDLERPAGWQVVPGRGSSVASNRNLIVRRALELEAEHVFFLDDDLVFNNQVLLRLLARNVEAVVGLSLRRQPDFEPLWFHTNQPTLDSMVRTLPTDGALMRLAAATSGGLLVKTDVFRRIEPPWWTLGQFEGRADEWNDDLDFCRKLAAAGVPLYGDPSVRFEHTTNLQVVPHFENGRWFVVLARGGQAIAALPMEDRR